MCYFECEEPCEVYDRTHPRSRVERSCEVCCAVIAKGDLYAGILRRGLGRAFVATRLKYKHAGRDRSRAPEASP